MIRTMILIPMLAALLACGLFTRAADPAAQVADPHAAPAEETAERAADPAAQVADPHAAPAEETAERAEDPTPQVADPHAAPAEETAERAPDPAAQVVEPHAAPAGGTADPLPTAEEAEQTVEVTGEILAYNHGDTSIEQKIFGGDAIVIATMTSFSSEVVVDADGKHRAVLKFNLDVSEYLKGSGASSIVAVWVDGWLYETREDGERWEARKQAERDDQWDDREAVIFLYDGGSGFGASIDGQLQLADHFLLALGHQYRADDRYSLHSTRNKVWLPAADSTGATGDGQEFLLDVPPTAGTAPTITLGDLKTRIAAVAGEFDGGDGSDAYETCVEEKYEIEQVIRYFREEEDTDAYNKSPQDSGLPSGQPANTELHQRQNAGIYPDQKAKTWLEGRDAALFTVAQGEPTAVDVNEDGSFTAESDAIEFTETFATARPLPAGEYEIIRKEVWARYLLCNYVLDNEWTITVTAPEGTLHEAFFDPVTDGTAVAADSANGVLKPASFTDTDGASATIERIAWEPSGTVKLKVSPHSGLAGHVVDFIELDGTVSLSLKVDDAMVDAANDTLSWSVASQPWDDGDELMVRVRGICRNGTAVPNPSDNSALMRDCINLLAFKDMLRGTATLNWSEDAAITSWDGVKVQSYPRRVTELILVSNSLTGSIPPDLGRLDGLKLLWLPLNQLTGTIPSELGSLGNLQGLILNDNQLTGTVPRELGNLSSLDTLWLHRNLLNGEIPAALGDLSNLQDLLLSENRLSGAIPSDLGDLSNLENLSLSYNQLTGEIPAALASLGNLRKLLLSNNQLTGCIPPALRDVDNNDLNNLGLQDCATP